MFLLIALLLLAATPALAQSLPHPLYAALGLQGSGTVTLSPSSVSGTWNWNYPAGVGTAGQPLLSGGGGSNPMTWGSRSGNTTTFGTTTGALTSGHCVSIDASGNLQDSGGACGGSGLTVGSTGISSGTANGLLYNSAGTLGNLATANSGVLVTSGGGVPSISTTLPNGLALGTPGSVTLTNGTGLPTTALTGTLIDTAIWSIPSTVTVAAGTTVVIPAYPWTSGTITAIHYATGGTSTPSFSASVQIGGSNVTGCNGITVSSSTDTTATCTAANTLSSGSKVTVVTSSISGSPTQAYVQINFTRSPN
jgi:hypothetical protein